MISRRAMLAAGPLGLAACRGVEAAYFGRTDPPQRQRLVAVLDVEPGSLDPATSAELIEERVIYPFDNMLLRYPLKHRRRQATDRAAVWGRPKCSRSWVPPVRGYKGRKIS